MTTQGGLTVITRIKRGHADALQTLLEEIGADPQQNDLVPFARLATIHFARWVILPEEENEPGGPGFAAQLVLSTSFDGALDEHLSELVDVAGAGLNTVYGHCEGYPDPKELTAQRTIAYLKDHAAAIDTFYVGAPGLSVDQIHTEDTLRTEMENFLDSEAKKSGPWSNRTPAQVRSSIKQFVKNRADLNWALQSPGPRVRTLPWYGWVATALVILLASPVIAAWLVVVRLHELRDPVPTPTRKRRLWRKPAPPPVLTPQAAVRQMALEQTIRAVTRREDHTVQNQLSHIVQLKPGWFRLATLRIVLKILNFGAHRIYNQGNLLGVSTLHFVRWQIIDEGRRLLFLTNYDGSMGSYIGDFINKSWQIPSALTGIWSNTRNFPKTRWLVLDGARDIPRFTDFLREHQADTPVWYSAYERLTTGNIVNNAGLRRGLSDQPSEQETAAWLRRF